MGAAQRQRSFRKRVREQGMVDVRLDIPATTRDKVKAVAKARNSTMKAEIKKAIEELARAITL